ncbi:MAG: endolytic transglycosylase MltG [Lactobacillales bacterium]|jgi:UPF0755 protein|nr:endolytic transglycosylase MltG [Lactobacillales bacterium]
MTEENYRTKLITINNNFKNHQGEEDFSSDTQLIDLVETIDDETADGLISRNEEAIRRREEEERQKALKAQRLARRKKRRRETFEAFKNRRREDKRELNEEQFMNKYNKKKSGAQKAIIAVVGVLLVLVVAALVGLYTYDNSLKAADLKNNEPVSFLVSEGESTPAIASNLHRLGFIKNATVLRIYLKLNPKAAGAGFQAGYHTLSQSMNVKEIIENLEQPGNAKPTGFVIGKVVIPEGEGIAQIADDITQNVKTKAGGTTPFSKDEFLALMTDDAFIKSEQEKYPKLLAGVLDNKDVRYPLEGYLFPATYDYSKDMTVKDLVDEFLETMNNRMSDFYDEIAASGKTVHEILTLASYAENEAITTDDRKTIVGVFENRVAKDMPLQTDVSVLYAMGKHKEIVTNADLKTDNPYNLYLYKGLGPGPVCSPSLDAITAAVEPAVSDYLYFVADIETGKVYFSTNFTDHQKLAKEHVYDKQK